VILTGGQTTMKAETIKEPAVYILHQGIADPRKFYAENGEEIDLATLRPCDYVITIREPPRWNWKIKLGNLP
jgi:hypothetical protein